ncbi:SDR family oxidoreductase [Cellulomonas sp. C5510]|uniref:SDR family NAD(P)-dependent oxidoreductase n=1 Tax=Cellulomonas sp. C5510 TaxID=2871170 RepID=UPI002105F709|nr:SDR family oxidoreductase [Cellulomonas sp. C5510]
MGRSTHSSRRTTGAPHEETAITTAARPVAVVTGASSGIGEEFARRFAARGHDLVLVARREDRLTVLGDALAAEHGVSVTVLPVDLADPGGPAEVAAGLRRRGLRADALVNSAGFGTYGPFATEDPARIAAEVQVNVVALTVLSRLLLPDLVAAPAGVLVNVASTAAYQPGPSFAVYAATKAYVRSLTEAIWQEHRGTALRVLSLAPGPTETEFFEVAGSDRFRVGQVLTVAQVVDVAFRALDRRDPPPSVVAGRRNAVAAALAGALPRRLVLRVAGRLTGE